MAVTATTIDFTVATRLAVLASLTMLMPPESLTGSRLTHHVATDHGGSYLPSAPDLIPDP
jgi:hypothetical protein